MKSSKEVALNRSRLLLSIFVDGIQRLMNFVSFKLLACLCVVAQVDGKTTGSGHCV